MIKVDLCKCDNKMDKNFKLKKYIYIKGKERILKPWNCLWDKDQREKYFLSKFLVYIPQLK